MAKINFTSIQSGFTSVSDLNQNFVDLESELQNNILYRNNPSGEPNQMQNDLDMNGFNILNIGAGTTGLASASTSQAISSLEVGSGTYTLVASTVAYRWLEMSSTLTQVAILTSEGIGAWQTGQTFHMMQKNTGQILISPETSVSVRYTETLKTRKQFSTLQLVYLGSDVWQLIGDVEIA